MKPHRVCDVNMFLAGVVQVYYPNGGFDRGRPITGAENDVFNNKARLLQKKRKHPGQLLTTNLNAK